ncbi:MAG: hypothetical protein H0X38_16655 [Planctomycetes bacterium]|nr:hypothetical protein [Planctomycetota bacterium]
MSAGRWRQLLLTVTFVPACWLAMMAVHELGHVLAGWATGGTVDHVVLGPFALSRTEMRDNPHPLCEIWSGPLLGALLPWLLVLGWRLARVPATHLPRFFAGFCLVANGAYLMAGACTGDGDAGELIGLGAPVWVLVVVGLPMLLGGLRAWHGLGPAFGMGNGGERVAAGQVVGSAALLALIIMLELVLTPR